MQIGGGKQLDGIDTRVIQDLGIIGVNRRRNTLLPDAGFGFGAVGVAQRHHVALRMLQIARALSCEILPQPTMARRILSMAGPICAQRLAVSKEFSLQSSIPLPSETEQYSTPFGINGIITNFPALIHLDSAVLNAFRHQWNHHHGSTPRAVVNRFLRCSTPFGINGIITGFRICLPVSSILVLNAFRHQWNHHCLMSRCAPMS